MHERFVNSVCSTRWLLLSLIWFETHYCHTNREKMTSLDTRKWEMTWAQDTLRCHSIVLFMFESRIWKISRVHSLYLPILYVCNYIPILMVILHRSLILYSPWVLPLRGKTCWFARLHRYNHFPIPWKKSKENHLLHQRWRQWSQTDNKIWYTLT